MCGRCNASGGGGGGAGMAGFFIALALVILALSISGCAQQADRGSVATAAEPVKVKEPGKVTIDGDVRRYYDEEFEVACYMTRGGVPLGCTRVD